MTSKQRWHAAVAGEPVDRIPEAPAGDVDYAWLAENFGGRTCLNCGLDVVKLRFCKPADVRADVERIMATLAPTRRFIFGTSDSITEGTPDENVEEFFRAAREVGRTVC